MTIDFTTNIDSLLTKLSKEVKENPKPGPKVSEVDFSTDIQSLYNNLANESNRISAEITSTLEDLGVDVKDDVQDIIKELSVELKKDSHLGGQTKDSFLDLYTKVDAGVSVEDIMSEGSDDDSDDDEPPLQEEDVTPEEVHDLVSQSAELLSTLEELDYKPDADNAYLTDVGRLAKRIEIMQNTLAELTSVGSGQAGMTYGSGEVRLEFLDDIDKDSAKIDGMFLQYQVATNKWIGTEGGDIVIQYSKEVDFVDASDLIYVGEALPGSTTASASWRIKKIDLNVGTDSDIGIRYADGDSNFNNVWDNHLSLTYS